MINAMTRHEIQTLRAAKMGHGAVSARTDASIRSVRRIEREVPVTSSETAALIEARHVGRPSIAAGWTEQVAA